MPDFNELTDLEKGLLEMARETLATLKPGDTCTFNDLIPETFLKETEGEHTGYGRRFSSLVARGFLPLVPDGFSTERHNQYRVTANLQQWLDQTLANLT